MIDYKIIETKQNKIEYPAIESNYFDSARKSM